MIDLGMALRIIVMLLFLTSAGISLYAARKRTYAPHLWGVAAWCIHVVGFTLIATLRAVGTLTISPTYLNIWSNAVRLHGGIVVLSTALYYLFKKE